MAIDREMPLKEQMKFDIRAQEVDIMEGDPQLDADGGATIDFGSPQPMMGGHNENLAENMNDGDLEMIARELSDAYEGDKESRGDWSSTYAEGLELLGMQYEDRTNPFPGASGVSHPLLAESVTQFQAQSYKELFPAGGPVKTQIMGAISPQVEQQSQRVKEFMNFQLTHVMEEYEPELDQMLFHLPLSGSAFRKIYFDNTLGRPVSKFVSSEDLVVPYEATDLHTCSRITHVVKMMSNDLRKFQVSGFYRDIPVGEPSEGDPSEVQDKIDELDGKQKTYTKDDVYTLLEMHVDLDLPGYEDANEAGEETGIRLPYIVTIEENSNQILSIRRNWNETDPLKIKKQPAGDLRASLMTLPYKEPSGTLFNLLGFVIDSGKSFAAVADMKLGEGNEVNPVGTTMALLERGMKVMSAIHKRMHAAQGKEFKLLAKLFAESLPPVYPYQIVGGNQAIKAQDFDARIDVIPVSDPNIFSVTQRVTLAQQQLQLAQAAPQMHNIYEAYRRMYEAMGVQNIDAILAPPQQPQPKDPATENSEILAGMPAQAFPGQNHDAHIEAHFSMMHSTVVKSSPIVMANLQAHIMQHISLKAQEEIQQEVMAQMQQLPPEQQQMMQQQMMMEMQSRVAERESELIAEFVAEYEELLKQSSGDPLLDFKREELDVKQQDMMRKAEEASERLGFEKKKARDKKATDRAKIDQQKDAIALRSAIATEKLEKDSINKVMDKAEKITSNMDKITSNIIKPNGGL
jgi:hypothetical protein